MWVAFWLFVSVLLGVLSLPDYFPREVREGALVLAAVAFLVFVWAAAGALIIRIKLRPQAHSLLERPRVIRGALVALALILMASTAPTVHRWYEPRVAPVASAAPAATPGFDEKALREFIQDAVKEALPPPDRSHSTGGYRQDVVIGAPRLFLYDRDPESWRGHRYGEGPLRLDEAARLEMPVGAWQRFNPQIQTAESLFGVNVFVIIPSSVEVQPTEVWRISSSDAERIQYWARFGDVNPGVIHGIDEALHLRVLAPRRFNIAYVISARGERSGGIPPTPTTLIIEAK